jgi:hypothetical protein
MQLEQHLHGFDQPMYGSEGLSLAIEFGQHLGQWRGQVRARRGWAVAALHAGCPSMTRRCWSTASPESLPTHTTEPKK